MVVINQQSKLQVGRGEGKKKTSCLLPLSPPHERPMGIPMGRGIAKAKVLEEKYRTNLEFPEG